MLSNVILASSWGRSLMPAIIAALILSFSPSALRAAASQNQQSADVALLSEDELFDLVGPIALYPDELLAIVLPVSVRMRRPLEEVRKCSTS